MTHLRPEPQAGRAGRDLRQESPCAHFTAEETEAQRRSLTLGLESPQYSVSSVSLGSWQGESGRIGWRSASQGHLHFLAVPGIQ